MKWLLKAIAWLFTLSCSSALVHFKQVDRGSNGCKINGVEFAVGEYMQDANTCGAYTCQNTEGHAFIHYCQIPATFAECVETAVITTIDFPQCCWACASWAKCDGKKDVAGNSAQEKDKPKEAAAEGAGGAAAEGAGGAAAEGAGDAAAEGAGDAAAEGAGDAAAEGAGDAAAEGAGDAAAEGAEEGAARRTKHKMNEKKHKASLVLPKTPNEDLSASKSNPKKDLPASKSTSKEDLPASKSTSKEDIPASKSTLKEDMPASKSTNKPAESKPNQISIPGTKKPEGPRGTDAAELLKFGGRTPITKFGEAPTVDQPSEEVGTPGVKFYESPNAPNENQGQP